MTNKVKVLIADDLAPGAADIFRNRGVEVDMKGWSLAVPGPKDVAYEVRWA